MTTISVEGNNRTSTILQGIHTVDISMQLEEAFKQKFCHQCRDFYICVKDAQTLTICKQLVNTGA